MESQTTRQCNFSMNLKHHQADRKTYLPTGLEAEQTLPGLARGQGVAEQYAPGVMISARLLAAAMPFPLQISAQSHLVYVAEFARCNKIVLQN